jgi:hypothetical protein
LGVSVFPAYRQTGAFPAYGRQASYFLIEKENKATGAIEDTDISIYSEPSELISFLISIFGLMKLNLSLSVLVLRGRDLFYSFYSCNPMKHSKFLGYNSFQKGRA